MTWLQRYRIRQYFKNSMWILPLLSMAAAMAAVRLVYQIDSLLGWEAGFDPGATQMVLGTMASSMFTFIVFVSSALLVAVQLASSQLTPRIIAIVFSDPVTKGCLTLFVFSFTFTLAALLRVANSVPPFTAYLAAHSCLLSLGVFLYLLDHVGKTLRPSGALRAVTSLTRSVIENVYPRKIDVPAKTTGRAVGAAHGSPTFIVHSAWDGVVVAFDVPGLVLAAQRADCVIEMVPQVGDFVAVGDPLFRIFANKQAPCNDSLRQSIAVAPERTLEQDPAFGFRIIVDIASKGLSPAINDPTTAVLALDHIHHLLRNLGGRRLDDGRVCDAAGQLRLTYRTPDWEDFVQLAITEIRHFGGTSIQVARRLRAMIEDLIQTLPEERTHLLRDELKVLHRSIARYFTEPEDRALADVSDFQGVGGKQALDQYDRSPERPAHS
jgi:uncharacterized membrane protein